MKKFISGLHTSDDILRYRSQLVKKYNLPSQMVQQADLIVLDGFICKDRYNTDVTQNTNKVNKIIIGCATPFGDRRLYYSFDKY